MGARVRAPRLRADGPRLRPCSGVPGSSFRLRESLASDARTGTGGGSIRARHLLIVGDLALALVLLSGAGLMVRSVRGMMLADPGFAADGVLTAQFSLVGEAYREDPAVFAFQNRVLEKARALPGVEAAAVAGQVPMGKNYDTWGFHIEGLMHANTRRTLRPAVFRLARYFKTMQIPLRRGRLLSDADVTDGMPVVVVSESTAQLWANEDPLGRRVRIGGPDSPWRTVVGIVGDVRHASLDEQSSMGMYLPQSQLTDSFLVLTSRQGQRNRSGSSPKSAASSAISIPRCRCIASNVWTTCWRPRSPIAAS